jgi:hypothetical protein
MKSVPQRSSVGSAVHLELLLLLRDVMHTFDPPLPRYGTDSITTVALVFVGRLWLCRAV